MHPLHVENYDSNSRLVVDEDDNGKLRLERLKVQLTIITILIRFISTWERNECLNINIPKCLVAN